MIFHHELTIFEFVVCSISGGAASIWFYIRAKLNPRWKTTKKSEGPQ